jgi:hypothetical protein
MPTHWVQQFKGYSDSVSPGANPVITNDLLNVKIIHGQVRPRDGLSNYQSITTPADTTIVGLFDYQHISGTNQILRMTENKLELLSGGSWNDVTGTALTGASTTRPQYTIIDDTLVFTNEGNDLPRKYTGSGNSSSIANGTSPYGKSIIAYLGFLLLGNVSDSGTFTDVTDGHRIIRYSDDWDNDWTLCNGTEIVLHETPGSLLRMLVLGRDVMCYKTDGLVRLTWVGGNVVFKQEKVDFNIGFVSPLGIIAINDEVHIGLGNDGVIYAITQSEVTPLTYDSLYKTLPPTISNGKLKYARGMDNPEEGVYYLFYDRTGLSGQLLDSYVAFNYRDKTVVKGRLGKSIIACQSFRPTSLVGIDLLVSTATLVDEFDAGATNDDGTTISSYWTTGQQSLQEEGWLMGMRLIFDKPTGRSPHVEVSVAVDGSNSFQFPETFRIIGGDPDDDFVEIAYRPPPIYANFANVKLKFKSSSLNAGVELRKIGFEVEPKKPMRTRPVRESDSLSL